MLKVIYGSRAVAGAEDGLVDLLTVARARNQHLGITGLLIYADGSFMQHIEGDDSAVTAVFDSILADDRHRDIRVLAREPVQQRRFGDWWMGFEEPDADVLAANLPGFKSSVTYPLVNPDLVLNATVAETLLRLYARNP